MEYYNEIKLSVIGSAQTLISNLVDDNCKFQMDLIDEQYLCRFDEVLACGFEQFIEDHMRILNHTHQLLEDLERFDDDLETLLFLQTQMAFLIDDYIFWLSPENEIYHNLLVLFVKDLTQEGVEPNPGPTSCSKVCPNRSSTLSTSEMIMNKIFNSVSSVSDYIPRSERRKLKQEIRAVKRAMEYCEKHRIRSVAQLGGEAIGSYVQVPSPKEDAPKRCLKCDNEPCICFVKRLGCATAVITFISSIIRLGTVIYQNNCVAQIGFGFFGKANDMCSSVESLASKIEEKVDQIPNASEIIDGIKRSVDDMLNTTVFSALDITVRDVLKACGVLTALWVLVKVARMSQEITQFLSSLLFSVLSIPTQLKDLFVAWMDVSMIEPSAQIAVDNEMLFTWLPKICAMFASLFVAYGVHHIPGRDNTPAAWLNKIGNFPRAIKSMSEINDYLLGIFRKIYVEASIMIFGYDRELYAEGVPEITQWQAEVELYSNPQQCKSMCKTRDGYNHVMLLWSRGHALLQKYAPAIDNAMKDGIRRDLQRCAKIKSLVESSFGIPDGVRAVPLPVWLVGESQIGKTTMQYMIAADLCAALGIYNVEEQIFCRCVENEFWEGYNGQSVVVFDDFGQMKDSTAAPNLEFFEIIRSIGSFPYPLHMADISLKSNSFFTSPIVICSTNSAHIPVESLTYEDAIWNRLTHSWRVTIKPEYQIIETNNLNGSQRVRLNVPLARETAPMMYGTNKRSAINMNVYNFERFRAIDRKAPQYEQAIGYDEFIKIHVEELKARQNQGVNLNENIRAYSAHLKARDAALAQCGGSEIVSAAKNVPTFGDMLEYFEKNETTTWPGYFKQYTPEMINEHLHYESIKMRRNGYEPKDVLLDEYTDYARPDLVSHFIRIFLLDYYQCWMHATNGLDLLHRLRNQYRRLPKYYDGAMNFFKAQLDNFRDNYWYRFAAIAVIRVLLEYAVNCFKSWWSKPSDATTCESDTRNLQPKARQHLVVRSTGKPVRMQAESDTRNLQPKARQHLTLKSHSRLARVEGDCEMGLDQNMMSVLESIRHQQWYAMLRYEDGTLQKLGTLTNVTGTIYMMPDHFVRYVQVKQKGPEPLDRIILVNVGNPLCDKHILIEDFIHNVITYNSPAPTDPEELKDHAPKDLCFIDAGRTMPRGKNIMKHFMSSHELYKLASSEFNGVLSGLDFNKNNQPELVRNHGTCFAHQQCSYYLAAGDVRQKYTSYDVISYSMPTKAGDCGQLLHCNSAVIREGRIVGMHISTNGENTNYSQVVTKEDIERAVQEFPGSAQCVGSFAHLTATDKATVQSGFICTGEMKPLPQASGSCIVPSTLHGLIQTPTCKPAFLKPFTNSEGKLIDPLVKGVSKAGVTCGIMDRSTLNVAVADVKLRIQENHVAEPPHIRVLTYEEAVRGIEGNELFQPINRSTSPGYPWCMDRKGKPGKTKWLGSDEYDFTSPAALEMRAAVEDLVEACRTDQPRDIIWIDTLKDERRPIEKVDEGKTRVFSNGPMHYNIAFRQYFMAGLAHIRHNRIYNGIGVGINVWSNEWNFLANYLTANSKTMIDGDFSNYDGTLSDQIMWEAFEVLHSLYDDGPENYKIRYNLWYYACFATRLVRDKVYTCTHSLPSGFPATAEVNSIYQLIAFRCIFLKLARIHAPAYANMAAFNKMVRLIIYGDDNIVSISEEIIDWFNMESIKEAFATYLNMTYTNPQKTSEIVLKKDLSQVSFLKRSFRRPTVDGYTYPMYVCPADIESRLEMLNWTRTGNLVNPKEIEADIVSEVFKELAMHGSDVYNEYVPKITKLALSNGLRNFYDLGCETYIESVVKNIPLKMHPNDF